MAGYVSCIYSDAKGGRRYFRTLDSFMNVQTSIGILDRVKDVPYPVDFRPDSIGHGFKDLKGKPHLVADIPELSNMLGMQRAVRNLCLPDAPFFSIGCEKRFDMEGDRRHCGGGYIEFAFNFERAAQYSNYLKLHDTFMKSRSFKSLTGPTTFEWTVSPINMRDHGICIQSCTVRVFVSDRKTPDRAVKALNQGFEAFGAFIGSIQVPDRGLTPLF